jgi:hypothetical protein
MVHSVSYDRQTVGSLNPAKRMAHRSRLKRAVSLADRFLPANGSLLDFGAGPGKFLNDVKSQRPDGVYFGYDKFKSPDYEGIRYVKSMADVADNSIDVLTAFEVLEHVLDKDLATFMTDSKRALKDSGTLIVSVPIMYGPIVMAKEASQMIAFRRKFDYSPGEFFRVLFGLSIPRPEIEDRFKTHKGFDFRRLRDRLSEEFHIRDVVLSPFPGATWVLNSQIFFIATPRSASQAAVS